ncbi:MULTISPECIES: Imm43 family immunity protein [Lysinibacillus]|nr:MULTISPECIES: Imm43 family immunity protein [Lysinibacillus]KUF34099.1 hypothetical protein AK833_10550 [Lysinibacillus sp. F5]
MEGFIHESFDETKYNEGMGYEWNKIFFVKQDMPKDLWLITNNKIEFDYYESFNGHIVSCDFLTLMNQVNTLQKYVISNLQVVSSKGKSKVKKPYYFIKYYNREDFVDYEKSEFTKRRVPENKIPDLNYLVEKYQKIVLKENDRDVFCLNYLKLARYLFCSERFKQLCEERHMKGIRFIELEDIPHYFSSYDR